MGLFDNLFLDQNTPVMINDGVDHSKDVVTEIIPPSSGGGVSSVKGSPESETVASQNPEMGKQEEGFEELFEEEKIKEVVDMPAPAVEFKLSPETLGDSTSTISIASDSVASEKLDDSGISFDIGGDMNFDIGGDIGESSGISDSVNTSGSFIESNVSIDSLGSSISGDISPSIQSEEASGSSVEVINTEIIPEIPQEVTSTLMESQNVGNNNETDSALFSLLNDNSSDSNPIISDVISTKELPVPSSESSSIIGNTTIISEDKEEATESIFDASVISHSSPAFIDTPIHSDTISPTTSKLKSKLEEFIDELKTLEIEDQEVKIKKRQQFEMFRVRAQEIKAEYDMRIRALELEEKALENQIAAMDNEKTQIKDVIRAFKLELEKA